MRLAVRSPIPDGALRQKAQFLKSAGFEGIELGPECMGESPDALRRQLEGTDIAVSAICGCIELLNPDPEIRKAALQTESERLRMAKTLGATALIEVPVFGQPRFHDLPMGESPHDYARKALIAQLTELAPVIEETGVVFLIEPLNRYETRFLNRLEQAADICEAVGCPGIRILADFFHMQIEEKDIAAAIRTAGGHIGYVHVVDSNRFEPGAGHTDFGAGFAALHDVGYDGWLTIESGIMAVENGQLVIEMPPDPETALSRAGRFLRERWKGENG